MIGFPFGSIALEFYSLRSEGLKAGYQAELEMLSKKLDGPKSALEAFYAKRLEDQQIHTSPEHQTEMNGLIDSADLALNEFATAIKPIRNAVVPWYLNFHIFFKEWNVQ